jgi:hypothetical protein
VNGKRQAAASAQKSVNWQRDIGKSFDRYDTVNR